MTVLRVMRLWRRGCGFLVDVTLFEGWLVDDTQIPGSCTVLSGGTGIPDTDLFVYVTAENVSSCAEAGSTTLAYASNCQRDQQDRPIFGLINFCPGRVPASKDSTYDTFVAVAIHELMHVLGA